MPIWQISLAAIKKLVYEEKKITRQELWDAIVHDFAGEQGQKIQHMLINDAPKYGNDNDDVDQLVVDAYASYIDEMKKYPNTRYGRGPIGGIRYAGTSSISAEMLAQGFGTHGDTRWKTCQNTIGARMFTCS